MKLKICFILLVVFVFNSLIFADDFSVIDSRLQHLALGYQPGDHGNEPPSAKETAEANSLVGKQRSDGSWPGIDYESRQRSFWPSSAHINNIIRICQVACRLDGNVGQKQKYSDSIHKAIGFWQAKDLRSDNWWHHQIFMPMQAGQLMLMLGDEATGEERDFLLNKIMSQAKIRMTGQNKIWLSDNVFVRSLFVKDRAMAEKAIKSILDELKVTTGEGMQPDWSFHQHGPQLQFGNYGLAFVGNMTKWLWVVSGTEFENKQQVELMRNYLLYGQRWVVWKDFYDISSCGRQIFAGQPNSKARSLVNGFKYMKMLDPEYSNEYQQYLDQMQSRDGENKLTGNTYFWRSDYMVHRREDFMASVKMNSNFVLGTEAGGNNENQLGGFLSDGACFFYSSGNEYKDIFPAWDWRQIPGATLIHSEDAPPRPGWSNKGNMQPFVGGLSDGENGFCVMDYDVEGVAAKKAWFACGDVLVCLGSGITSASEDKIYTTINQCHLDKDSLVDQLKGRILEYGSFVVEVDHLVQHGGFVYSFPEKQDVKLECGKQSGSWKMIAAEKSDRKIDHDIFKLYIDHGEKPQGAKYCYVVQPVIKLPEDKTIILSNSGSIQAVSSDGSIMAVFYKPAKLTWHDNSISVDKPCVAMLVTGEDKELFLNIADPSRKEKCVVVKIRYKGQEYIKTVTLPEGNYAGSAVVIDILK